MRTQRLRHTLLAGATAALIATSIGFVARSAGGDAHAGPAVPGTADMADVAERVVDSVVNVSSTSVVNDGPFLFDPFFSDPFSPGRGAPDARKAQSLGSGVIVSADGRVLTNAHVVRNAESIRVTLHDGDELGAKLIGIDPKSDVAVLQLQGKLPHLEPLPFGDSSKLRLGEVVLAVGNPFGVGQAVTMGIVSATGRASLGIADYEDFIQTDAAINPGNSGGALVNMRGELIGINTAILSRTGGYQGIGFAIPTNMARPIMDMLVADGKVSRGWLGVSLAPNDAQMRKQFSVKNSRGVIIAEVGDHTPAAKAGLRAGDVVTAIDGVEVRELRQLRNAVAMKGADQTVSLAVVRKGKDRTIKVKLGTLPEPVQAKADPKPQTWTRGERVIIHPDGRVERQPIN